MLAVTLKFKLPSSTTLASTPQFQCALAIENMTLRHQLPVLRWRREGSVCGPGNNPVASSVVRCRMAGHGCVCTLWSPRTGGRTLLLAVRSFDGSVGRADDARGLD
jgi:hypothetical protein